MARRPLMGPHPHPPGSQVWGWRQHSSAPKSAPRSESAWGQETAGSRGRKGAKEIQRASAAGGKGPFRGMRCLPLGERRASPPWRPEKEQQVAATPTELSGDSASERERQLGFQPPPPYMGSWALDQIQAIVSTYVAAAATPDPGWGWNLHPGTAETPPPILLHHSGTSWGSNFLWIHHAPHLLLYECSRKSSLQRAGQQRQIFTCYHCIIDRVGPFC
ncbi:uncharacterized protein LOC110256055 [Sus scrofa]|uniref:uncharacterized protein LOC110256055 n=1 Tax=Sus scrofa TaxID=9823 RepID=UPI000A2B2AE3|nr:uncharacterized protein LOC110256055 [Sus scrofa]